MTSTLKPITEDDAFRLEDRAPISTRYTTDDTGN